MSWLAHVAGLDGVDEAARKKALPLMEAQAGFFLAAGGSITPELWEGLETDERAAFVGANERLVAERTLSLVAALRGDTSELARKVGGERARTRNLLVREAVSQ